MVEKYIQGGDFMHPILALLIIGIAISLAKAWSLFRASINTKKFIVNIKSALTEGGVESAKEVCESTRGPVASIFHAGLSRSARGLEHVEKAIVNAGTIEMAFLERGLVWLGTFIAVAPMLGFLGTVWGMVEAFDNIAAQNDITPTIVASGISKALLTTLFGLIVAIIMQTAHNFFVSRIDKLIIDMEESSVDFVDVLIEMDKTKE